MRDERGAELLAHSEGLGSASDIVRWYHERHDGSGYPDGISGDSISLAASIVSVADAWDAMTSDRHYRKGMAPADARRVLEETPGSNGTRWRWHCSSGTSEWPDASIRAVRSTMSGDRPATSPG